MTPNIIAEELAPAVRSAIAQSLGELENYHLSRMEGLRAAGEWKLADQQQRMAETVRACIVTAQVAAGRAIMKKEPRDG